jgi:hypothetical protein
VHFYFSPHDMAADAPNLRERISQADIFAPETFAWSPDQLKAYELISRGDSKQYLHWQQIVRRGSGLNSYTELQMSSLYNQRIPVIFFDIDNRHSLTQLHRRYLGLEGLADALQPDLMVALEGLRRLYTEKQGPIVRQREDCMVKNLIEGITATVEDNTKLQTNDNVLVLIALGSDHTRVYHHLRAFHTDPTRVTREFSDRPAIFPYSTECLRAGKFGVRPTDEAIAGSYAELIIRAIVAQHNIPLRGQSTMERTIDLRQTIAMLSKDELRVLHNVFNLALDTNQPYDLNNPVVSKVVQGIEHSSTT